MFDRNEMKDYTMSNRMFSVAAVAVTLFVSSPAWAAKEVSHDGKFVSAKEMSFVMTAKGGKEHSHTLAADAKVTCDGDACKLADLKTGTKIRVTTKHGDKNVATHVEAIIKDAMFAHTHEGKFVSIKDHKLVMMELKGKEHSHVLADDATMTCDGKACKVDQIKAGMKIRVTTNREGANHVTHVEALDKDTDFSQVD